MSAGVSTAIYLGRGSSPVPTINKPAEKPQPLKAAPKPSSVQPADVELVQLDLRPVFPVFYKFYDDHPVGTLVVKNNFEQPLNNMSVKIFVKQYMDDPKDAVHTAG